jgi:ERF superfamily
MNELSARPTVGDILDSMPVTTSIGDGILSVIARAAADPNVDIDKLERLLEMQERVLARDAEMAFNVAMNAAQAEMRPISANASNPQTKSRYASFDKLDKVMRPIYTRHGFSLSFDEGDSPKPEHVRVICYASHNAGHTRTYRRDMPADGKGAKGGDVMTKTHAAGAAGSYGSRYLLKGIFNIAVGEDDDDGNGQDGPSINAEQFKALDGVADAVRADKAKFGKLFKVDSLRDLPATRYTEAVARLREKDPAAADAFMFKGAGK